MPSHPPSTSNPTGILCGIGAFACWGLFPLFWQLLREVPSVEVLAHRVVWSLLVVLLLVLGRIRFGALLAVFLNRRLLAVNALSATLLAINWGVFIWAVTHGFVLQASLGYFINPILNVLIGIFKLKERLTGAKKAAIGLAALGCICMTVVVGELPWVSLLLGGSFAIYGYIRKMSPLGSLHGLAIESIVLFPVALGYLLILHWRGTGTFGGALPMDLYLACTGIITSVPLLLFSEAARRIPLSTLGLLQYIGPSGQFLLGIFYFKEAFGAGHFISFSFIWIALVLFSSDLIQDLRAERRARAVAVV